MPQLIRLLLPLTTILFGRFLGSKGISIMTEGQHLVLFALLIIIIGVIILFRLYGIDLRKKYGSNSFLFARICVLFLISIFISFFRVYFSSCCFDAFSGLLVMYASGGEIIPSSGTSSSEVSVNQAPGGNDAGPSNVAPADSPLRSFPSVPSALTPLPSDPSVPSLPSLPSIDRNEREQPAPPANAVASPGEGAGPSRPYEAYPYPLDEVIGGDSVLSIQQKLLAKQNQILNPSPEDIYLAEIQAKDLFEVKVDIIRQMTSLDPEGDWLRRGARALDNPHTATGEESLERLFSFRDELNSQGKESQAFAHLKSKVFRKWDDDDRSSAS